MNTQIKFEAIIDAYLYHIFRGYFYVLVLCPCYLL